VVGFFIILRECGLTMVNRPARMAIQKSMAKKFPLLSYHAFASIQLLTHLFTAHVFDNYEALHGKYRHFPVDELRLG
jgi:hypothetical protein